MSYHLRSLLPSVAVSLYLVSTAAAPASEPVLLTLHAADGHSIASFTADDLAAMTRVEFTTTTQWTQGDITARALNDYQVSIPLDSLSDGAPIIADHINGAPFTVRENGSCGSCIRMTKRPNTKARRFIRAAYDS